MKIKMKVFYAVIIIFCCLLPIAESSNEIFYNSHYSGKSVNSNYIINSAELPVWETGDSWTYALDVSFNLFEDGIEISSSLSLENLNLIIEDVTTDNYIIGINSNIQGDFLFDIEGIPKISGDLIQTELDGQIIIEKINFGLNEVSINIEGKLRINLIPININIHVTMNFDPVYYLIDFPIFVGTNWKTNWTDISIEGTIDLPGITALFPSIPDKIIIDNQGNIGGNNLLCENRENITLNCGEFDVYNISVDNSKNFYYSPVAGNIIKMSPVIIDNSNYELMFTFELTSTTYTMPGAPNKPEKPSGPNQGKINTEYTYTTYTDDLEGDDLFYYFDWGDGLNSGWIGPFETGETISSTHMWAEKGSYDIKVKAKDTNNLEGLWSDSLYSKYFLKIIFKNSNFL